MLKISISEYPSIQTLKNPAEEENKMLQMRIKGITTDPRIIKLMKKLILVGVLQKLSQKLSVIL